MHSGPHIKRDGLVFGYDTGYSGTGKNLSMGRHFKGTASSNILEVLNHSISNTSGTNGFVLNGEEVVKIPKVGRRTVKYVEYYNNHSNAGSLGCCPNLFYYHDGYVTGVESSTPYTYSIIYKHTGNYTHPNFMYRYEHQTSGTYNTEQGIHSTDRRTHLGNGWYHAWGTFTTQSTTTQLRCYSFLYNYGTTKHKFYVAAISIVKNTSGSTHLIIPPQLMLKPSTSISSTSSLIDLKETTNIDVSNVSFDSTGQPTFDGTDDYIQLPTSLVSNLSTSELTVEAIVYHTSWGTSSGSRPYVANWNTWSPGNQKGFILRTYTTSQYPSFWYCWGANYTSITASTQMNLNQYYHVVGVFKKDSYAKIYVNGVEAGSTTTGTGNNLVYDTSTGTRIGYGTINTGRMVGNLPVVKIYNRALSADEVQQNFKAYKTRFDI